MDVTLFFVLLASSEINKIKKPGKIFSNCAGKDLRFFQRGAMMDLLMT